MQPALYDTEPQDIRLLYARRMLADPAVFITTPMGTVMRVEILFVKRDPAQSFFAPQAKAQRGLDEYENPPRYAGVLYTPQLVPFDEPTEY
jgi:hypothetical protein